MNYFANITTEEAAKTRYYELAKRLHPDHHGGDKQAFQALQQQYIQCVERIRYAPPPVPHRKQTPKPQPAPQHTATVYVMPSPSPLAEWLAPDKLEDNIKIAANAAKTVIGGLEILESWLKTLSEEE